MALTIADDQILEAALAVIAERGYAGATTREIAAAAEINEVTLFRRFGNKQQLLIAAVEREAENLVAAGLEYTGDLEADLLRAVTFYRELARTRSRVLLMLVSEVPRQPELLEVMQTPIGIIRRITAMLARYQAEGRLVDEPPAQAFAALVGPLFLGGIMAYAQPALADGEFDAPGYVWRFLGGRAV